MASNLAKVSAVDMLGCGIAATYAGSAHGRGDTILEAHQYHIALKINGRDDYLCWPPKAIPNPYGSLRFQHGSFLQVK